MMHKVKKIGVFKIFASIFLFFSSINFTYAMSYVSVDEKAGLLIATDGGKQVIQSNYVYFGVEPSGKWTWAEQSTNFSILSEFQYQFTGKNKAYDYRYKTIISKINESAISFAISFDNARDIRKIIGGGIEFRLDASYNVELGVPRLLDDDKGWIWGDEYGEHFKLEFTQPVASVFFEKNNPNIIRVYFFEDKIDKSVTNYQATFSAPNNFPLRATNSELYGDKDIENWFEIEAPFYTPVDLSYLNDMPAGKHGFLKADGETLLFEDGSKEKFWGTNISAGALFSTPYIDVAGHARRIAALGFNLVRFTHHDSFWVEPNMFGKDAQTSNEISEDYMRIIDKWVAELNKQGVYIWFDFHHERYLTENDDIYGFDEIEKKSPNIKGEASLKGYSYFNFSIQNTMQALNKQLITRVNKETKERYADNKGIVFLLLTNENDITNHFGNQLLPAQNVPKHTQLYLDLAKVYADKHDLSYEGVWRSWVPGPSKLFLNDAEYNFNEKLLSSLREDDPNHLVITTNTWGNNPLFSLPALTGGDLIDVHSYGKLGALEVDPNKSPNYIHWIASAQVANLPLSVSEWNVGTFPGPDRHHSPLYVSAAASHQGWDAIMQFNYAARVPSRNGSSNQFEMYRDPAMLGTMSAAALMYRGGHLKEAEKTYAFSPTEDELINAHLNPETVRALRTIPEKSKLVIKLPKIKSLPWFEPAPVPEGAEVITSADFSIIAEDQDSVTSDTLELYRNWQKGIYTINSAKTKAAMGWIGARTIDIDGVEMRIENNSASVSVQALDNEDLIHSQNILISLAARAEPKDRSAAPIFAEPVKGILKIKARPGLKLFKHRIGLKYTELDVLYEDGFYNINLTDNLKTYWLFLKE